MRAVLACLLSALAGGGVAAGAVLLLADEEPGTTRTVVQQAPLAKSGGGGDGEGLTPAEIYKRDAPGVVFITAEVVRAEVSPFDLFPQERRGESTGTGFVIDTDGSILTNAHVVEGAQRVSVRFADGRTVTARLRGSDPSTDVALLQVDPKGIELRALPLGTSRDVEVGDPTVAIGNPFGLDLTLTTGVVSAKQRRIDAPNGFEIEDVIQTDAAINPGNSGGPLIDAAGRVIGINSAIRTGSSGGGSIGIGFAVPIDTAKRILPQLREDGQVERAYLGVQTAPTGAGALVDEVYPGTPAEKAGLRPGDVIVEVAGKPVRTGREIGEEVDRRSPGDDLELTVMRDGERETTEAKLEQRPDAAQPQPPDTVGP